MGYAVSVLRIFPVLILLSSLTAQQKPVSGAAPAALSKTTGKQKAKPKLTPEQEKGLKLLETAEAESAGALPEVHAYVLWQASRGYAKVDPTRVDAVLRDAFQATRSIENAVSDGTVRCERPSLECNVKGWLQELVLRSIRARSVEEVEALLPSAEPGARKSITEQLISDYAKKKNFDRARQLLDQFADDPDYPYRSAFDLMQALPEEQTGERTAVFAQALRSFHDYPPDASPNFGDFATLVVRYWQQLPPAMVMDAVDTILTQAKDKDDPETQFRIGIGGKNGDADFANAYEFRLFELLPIIRQLDSSKAESLLRENMNVASLLRAHPNGLQSLGGDSPKDLTLGIHSISYATGDNPMEAAVNQALARQEQQINERLEQIQSEAAKNPKQALQDAMNLPTVSPWGEDGIPPRLTALDGVARASPSRAPGVARAALEQERKLLQAWAPSSRAINLRNRADILIGIAKAYHSLGDQDGALSSLKQALQVAVKVYETDTNPDDPNRAFKAAWPSSHAWMQIVAGTAEIAPEFLDEVWSEISDPEIALLVKVGYADSLLHATAGFTPVLELRKSGVSGSMSAN